MLEIRYAADSDIPFWKHLDPHISEDELTRKVVDRRCYLLMEGAVPIGVMRYNLFWDNLPFLTFLYIMEAYRGKGIGRQAMSHWETEMRALGFSCVLTSTQADEDAQKFYRRIEYKDAGCLILDVPPLAQPVEIFLPKQLV